MNEKILIVDDERMMLELLGRSIEHAGYRVAIALDAQEALGKIESEKPHLIILDVMLPGVSGLDLCQRIRSDPKVANTPIIMLSAKVDVADRIAGLRAGADEYVVKPVMPAELVARVESLLERVRRLREEPAPKAAKVICFVGAKGGVGTTTTVINAGAALAMQGKSVVAAELRPYPGSFSTLLGLRAPKTLEDLLGIGPGAMSIHELQRRLPLHSSGLRVLCAPAAFGVLSDLKPDQTEAIVAGLARTADFVFIDVPPHPTGGCWEAIHQSTALVLLLEPVPDCLESAINMAGFLKSQGPAAAALHVAIVNRVPIAIPVSRHEIEEKLGWEVVGSLPRAGDECARAQAAGKPVVQSQPDSIIAQSFKELALSLA